MSGRDVNGFLHDLRYSFRLIAKSPRFSVYVILPLALGIGLNGAIFLLLDALLLRPLPVKNPESLARIAQRIRNIGVRSYYSYDELRALQKKASSFTDVIGYFDLNAAIREENGAARIRAQMVTGNFFTTLGVQPLYGRVLAPADELQAFAPPPVVLSYLYWQRLFRGDPNAVGKTILLDERPFTVVGIMPQSFNGVEVETTPDLRLPLIAADLLAAGLKNDSYRELQYSLAGRLRPGVSLETARAETESIVNSIRTAEQRRLAGNERVVIEPLANGVSALRPRFAASLVLLMCGVGLLMLIICANVSGLLLARASARRGENAVRLAIGAGGTRLARQWLTETMVLTSLGAGAGLFLAWNAIPLLLRAIPTLRDAGANALTLSVDVHPDWRFFAFAFGLAAACALLTGVPAALQASRANLSTALRASRSSVAQPWRWTLVAFQIGLCTFLIAGAGLLVSTFRHLQSLDPGFDQERVVAFSVDPAMARYKPDQAEALETRLVSRVRGLPGVSSAGVATIGVMHGTGMKVTYAPAGQKVPRSDFMNSSINFVSPDYFETMGIPLLAGRNFRPDEPAAKPVPVIVNRAFLKRFFPSQDAIGRKFGQGVDVIVPGDYVIIGVVGDAKYRSLREVIPPTVYRRWPMDSDRFGSFILYVRTQNRPESVIQPVRRALNAIDPRLAFYEIHTLAEEVDATLWAERLLAWLSSIFAGLAAALAMLGIYATLAYAIAQSRREIGIRVALGARAGDVLRLLSARPTRSAVLGVAAGLSSFYAATPAFRSVLYEVSPADPASLISAALAVLAVSWAATLVAIRGAFQIDPAALLREE